MAKMEKEIKILDIDVNDTKDRLEKIGAIYKGKKEQKIYTYDIPCINTRYDEILLLLKSDNELLRNSAIRKLEVLLDEYLDLEKSDIINKIEKDIDIELSELITLNSMEIYNKISNCKLLNDSMHKMKINPNKWVRLRQSNDEVELTVKHVYEKNNKRIQKVKEVEIKVNDITESNKLLEEIGLVRRNYQEKIRYSYVYKDAEIEIDEWPLLDPYMEIECDDEDLISDIISKLDYDDKRIVSLNTEQIYKEKGIDVLKISDLKF